MQEQELNATVRKQADADLYKAQRAAEAQKATQIAAAEASAKEVELDAEAKANATKAIGEAEAGKTKAIGLAQAEAIAKQAEAARQLDESGRAKMTIEAMPKIIEAAMSPYANVELKKLYGDGDLTKETSGSLEKQQYMLQEVAGIDSCGMLNGALMQEAGKEPVVDAKKHHEQPRAKAPDTKQPAPAPKVEEPATTEQAARSTPSRMAEKQKRL